jgi:Type IV pilin-like G and H, putative
MSQLIIANMAAPFFLSQTGNIWLFVSIIPVEMLVIFLCFKSLKITIGFAWLFLAVLVANIATSILGAPLMFSTLTPRGVHSPGSFLGAPLMFSTLTPRGVHSPGSFNDITNSIIPVLLICFILSFRIEAAIYGMFWANQNFQLPKSKRIRFSLLSNLASYIIFIPALTGFNYNNGGTPIIRPNPPRLVRELRVFLPNHIRGQLFFYSENDRFASNWQEFINEKYSFKEQIDSYPLIYGFYQLDIQRDTTKANLMVASKTKDLTSYRLTIFIVKDKDNSKFIQGICETDKPSMKAPEIPQLVDGKFQCPPGSSDKSDEFGLLDR